MRVAEVIGKVTLSKSYAGFRGATWLLAVPLDQHAIRGEQTGRGESFVVYDEWGANDGSLIGVSEGAEAAAPFHPDLVPLDAYNAAIFDVVEIQTARSAENEARHAES